VRRDKAFTASYTGQLALDADEMQYERGHGPCIEAGETGMVLLVRDMRQDQRWPDYAARVVPRGVLSSLSVPLPMQTDVIGALDCYSRTPAAFSSTQVDLAVELSAHIGATVAGAVIHHDTARYMDDMKAAMVNRAVIEQAKGIIMAQNRCDAEAAFTILSRASQSRNIKLRDLAREVVERASGTSRREPPPSP
jgi:ANTAR domain/GAF domain